MKRLTQAEFDAMQRGADGYIDIPGFTDCSDVNFRGLDCVRLGDGCTLGNRCKLGGWCKLGHGCTLGYWCTLGHRCTLGYWCRLGSGCTLGDGCKLGNECTLGHGCTYTLLTFEGDSVKDGIHITVGNIGSENRTAYFYMDKDGKCFVRAGCWFGSMEDFKTRVERVHGGTMYETEYLAACDYAQKVLPGRLKNGVRRAGGESE